MEKFIVKIDGEVADRYKPLDLTYDKDGGCTLCMIYDGPTDGCVYPKGKGVVELLNSTEHIVFKGQVGKVFAKREGFLWQVEARCKGFADELMQEHLEAFKQELREMEVELVSLNGVVSRIREHFDDAELILHNPPKVKEDGWKYIASIRSKKGARWLNVAGVPSAQWADVLVDTFLKGKQPKDSAAK